MLAGLPLELPGAAVNRLCGSRLDALGIVARVIKSKVVTLMIAGSVESIDAPVTDVALA